MTLSYYPILVSFFLWLFLDVVAVENVREVFQQHASAG